MSFNTHDIIAPPKPLASNAWTLEKFVNDLIRYGLIAGRYTVLVQPDGAFSRAEGHWSPRFPSPPGWDVEVTGPFMQPGTVLEGWLSRSAYTTEGEREWRDIEVPLTVAYDGDAADGLTSALFAADSTADLFVLCGLGKALHGCVHGFALWSLAAPLSVGSEQVDSEQWPWGPWATTDEHGAVTVYDGHGSQALDDFTMLNEGVLPPGWTTSQAVQTALAYYTHGGGLAHVLDEPPIVALLRRHLGPDLRKAGSIC